MNFLRRIFSVCHSFRSMCQSGRMKGFERCFEVEDQGTWRRQNLHARADKDWAVKRARPSKKVWCSGLELCLEMSPVFDFEQGLGCGLSIRHCRCHWIMAAWVVLLYFFLVLLCWYAVYERQMLQIFCGRFSWSRQTSLSNGFFGYIWDSITELYFRSITRQCRSYSKTKITKYCLKHEGKSHSCHPWQNQKTAGVSVDDVYFMNACSSSKV